MRKKQSYSKAEKCKSVNLSTVSQEWEWLRRDGARQIENLINGRWMEIGGRERCGERKSWGGWRRKCVIQYWPQKSSFAISLNDTALNLSENGSTPPISLWGGREIGHVWVHKSWNVSANPSPFPDTKHYFKAKKCMDVATMKQGPGLAVQKRRW